MFFNLSEKNFEIVKSTEKENEILNKLNDAYLKVNEMSDLDRRFCNSLILRNKPKKALEIGVSGGGQYYC